MEEDENAPKGAPPIKSLVIVFSYHNKNTEKIAGVFAEVLGAGMKTPQDVNPEGLDEFELIGFGSGVYGEKHHASILGLADKLPRADGKLAFIFSTFGAPASWAKGEQLKEFVAKNHSLLRGKLQSRGYVIVDEFSCPGLNTNSFLRFFGGLNKGRPNAEDFKAAEEFARGLAQKARGP